MYKRQEYGLLGLPEPSLVFYLDVPTELTEKMMREREQATNTKADIHEQDEAYLRACRENAKKVAERCSWQRIGCSKDGAMRTAAAEQHQNDDEDQPHAAIVVIAHFRFTSLVMPYPMRERAKVSLTDRKR